MDQVATAQRLLNEELADLRAKAEQGRIPHALKVLRERGVAQTMFGAQYSGRFAFELLQNANDAASVADAPGEAHVRFELTDDALLVANMGMPFREEDVEAICTLGDSTKDPFKTIGYKGVGFKSIRDVTDRPQIVSRTYRFEFDLDRARGEIISATGVDLDPDWPVPLYAFPFPIPEADLPSRAAELLEEGFATVLRLPFRSPDLHASVMDTLLHSIEPRLLLFLKATAGVEVVGTDRDFRAHVVRQPMPHGGTHVLMEVNGETAEEWLAFSRVIPLPEPQRDNLPKDWSKVTQVTASIAVPLDEHSRPTSGAAQPVHVYFPTQDHSGFPFIVNADFLLGIDRRHGAEDKRQDDYNRWLVDECATLLAEDVAPTLSEQHRDHALQGLAAVKPSDQSGLGLLVREQMLERLAGVAFVPRAAGGLAAPQDIELLPPELHDRAEAHRYLDESVHRLVEPAVEAHGPSARFLAEFETEHLGFADVIKSIAPPPPDDYARFLRWLGELKRVAQTGVFSLLRTARVFLSTTGNYELASDLFLPGARQDADVPPELRLAIAVVPDEAEDTEDLLLAAGVRRLSQEALADHVIKLLRVKDTAPQVRDAALQVLRRYHDEFGRNLEIRARAGQALLPATTYSEGPVTLRPANELYFPASWIGGDALELLYGAFDQPDFLAESPPPVNVRSAMVEFYSWLGVESAPRIVDSGPAAHDRYRQGSVRYAHPHRDHMGAWWDRWLKAIQPSWDCGERHRDSQQLKRVLTIDRIGQLLERITGDGHVLTATTLLEQLVSHPDLLDRTREATLNCQHQRHGFQRPVISPTWFALQEAAWVPAIRADELACRVPRTIWLGGAADNRRARRALWCVPDPFATQKAASTLAHLGVIDPTYATGAELAALLRALAAESTELSTKEAVAAARWLTTLLSLKVGVEPVTAAELGTVPLPCRHHGGQVFSERLYVAANKRELERWSDVVPILESGWDLSRLVDLLELPRLRDAMELIVRAGGMREAASELLDEELHACEHLLVALVQERQYGQAVTAASRLRRTTLRACDELVLEFELEGERRADPASVAIEAHERRWTCFAAVDQRGEPDWYAVGRELALHVGVGFVGDQFGIILRETPRGRRQYLESLGVELELDEDEIGTVDAERPSADILLDRIAHERAALGESSDVVPFDPPAAAEPSSLDEVTTAEGTRVAFDDAPPDVVDITLETVEDGELVARRRNRRSRKPGAGGTRPSGQEAERANSIGDRGEEIAFEAELDRVEQFGGDAELVTWVSKISPMSNHDIKSVDPDGQPIYIEVKATVATVATVPCEISDAELRFAFATGARHRIYRVLGTETAHPRVLVYEDIASLWREGRAHLDLSTARLTLPVRKDRA